MQILEMPHNTEAERRLVATVCLHPELTHKLQLVADDFYDKISRTLYQTICDLVATGTEISLVVIADRCKSTIQASTIAELVKEPLLEYEIESVADIVKQYAKRRALVRLAQTLATGARDNNQDIGELCQSAQMKLVELIKGRTTEWESNYDLVFRHFEVIEERYQAGGVLGIKSGFGDLDEITGGFQPGQLIFLGAAPKMGKTSFALHVALNCEVPVLFFTLEMLPEELADREFAATARINSKLIRMGRLDESAWRKISDALPELGRKPIYWVKQSGLTTADIRAISMRCKDEHGLGLIIIDQLDKIFEKRYEGESDATRIGRVTSALKNIARDLEVPLLCLVQLLDKAIARRGNPRPQPGDVRDSSYPDQDCDIMLYLWRPEFYYPDKPEWKNLAEIIVARTRSIGTGSVWVRWEPEYTTYQRLFRGDWPDKWEGKT